MEGKIIVAGIGPGSPDYILPAARRAIDGARVIVGGRRALDTLAPAGAKQKCIDRDLDGVMNFIRSELADQNVVVMVSGDPGFYSLLPALKRAFPDAPLEVLPGISSLQAAFARVGEPWQEAVLASMHGRAADEAVLAWRPGKRLGLLTDAAHNVPSIAAMLLERNWPGDARAWVCADLSYPDERVVEYRLDRLLEAPCRANCVLVVIG